MDTQTNPESRQWIQAIRADSLPVDDATRIEHQGVCIAIFNFAGKFYATSGICTHAHAFLSEGYIDGQTVECPLHQGLFRVPTGTPLSPPVTERLKTYETKVSDDGFRDYLDVYPVGDLAGGFVWKPGMGASFVGPYSKLQIKAPFTDYLPLPEGPVLDASKKCRIGLVFHGFNHPWLISLADTAAWEAKRHPNIELEVIDAEFDDNKMGQVIDTWIAKQYDGIVLWPNREAPMGPPVDRAIAALAPALFPGPSTFRTIV